MLSNYNHLNHHQNMQEFVDLMEKFINLFIVRQFVMERIVLI
jgi:hypothetical protein